MTLPDSWLSFLWNEESRLSLDRAVDVISCAWHGVFTFVAFTTVLVSYCGKKFCEREPTERIRFIGHTARWLVLFSVFLTQILFTFESILIVVRRGSSLRHVEHHLSNGLGLLATIAAMVFYHAAENYRTIQFLFALLFYWMPCIVLEVLKLYLVTLKMSTSADGVNYSTGDFRYSMDDVRYLLFGLLIGFYFLVWLLDIFILLKTKYLHRRVLFDSPVDDLRTIKYIPSYAHFLSNLVFLWLDSLMAIGGKRAILLEDLGKIPAMEEANFNYQRLKAAYETELRVAFEHNRPPSLWRCFWKLTRSGMLLSGFFKFLSDCLMYVPPFCLDAIVTNIIYETRPVVTDCSDDLNVTTTNCTNSDLMKSSSFGISEFFHNAFVLSFICFISLLLHFFLLEQSLFVSLRQGIRLKSALQAMVYEKSMRLLTSTVNEGTVMNHMTVDPLHIVMFYYLAHFLWALPITIILGLMLLYLQLGKSALISGIFILSMVPIQYFVGRRLAHTQKYILEKSDERLMQSNELLQNIKLLKLYAWEFVFYGRVDATRKRELRLMFKAALYRVLSATVNDGLPFWACAVTFTMYNFLETEPLHPGKVFSVMSLFSLFANQLFVTTIVINSTSHARISVIRLEQFLLMKDVPNRDIPKGVSGDMPAASKEKNEFHDGQDEVESDTDHFSRSEERLRLTTGNDSGIIIVNPRTRKTDPLSNGEDIKLAVLKKENGRIHPEPRPENVLEITGGNYTWITEQILFDINVVIPKGKLTVIIGPVGSGKSSLLWSMLGEMKIISEQPAYSTDRFALVPQKSWIINATVQENILLGRTHDAVLYNGVIEASGLAPDIEQFAYGDLTEIGEKGATLSGGQKQRISIARALYSEQDVYIMDDPMSALDAQVGSLVFEEAILKRLINQLKKTVILVTHHLHLLPHAHHLIVMKRGRIFYQGPPNDFHSTGITPEFITSTDQSPTTISMSSNEHPDLDNVVVKFKRHGSGGSRRSIMKQLRRQDSAAAYHIPSSLYSDLRFSQASIFNELDATLADEENTVETAKSKSSDVCQLMLEEEIVTGSVSIKYYWKYIQAATWPFVLLASSSYVVRHGLRMFGDYILTLLVEVSIEQKTAELMAGLNETVPNDGSIEYYLTSYAIIAAVCIVLVLFGMIFLELSVLTASKNLHINMLKGVVSAPMDFFDSTPIGRILNRLSSDLNTVDEKLIGTFDGVLFCSLVVIGSIVMNTVFVPYFAIPVIPLFIAYFAIQRYYISTCRELQRLDCTTKSPVLAQFSQTLSGLATIRAYRLQKQFQVDNWKKLDNNNLTFLFFHATNSWVAVRLDILGSFIVLLACLAATVSGLLGRIEPGTVGLVVAYAIMMCAFLNWMMRSISEVEMYFNNIERIIQYAEIESEPYHVASEIIPSASWPTRGEIKFIDVSIQYRNCTDPVVRGFSLHVKPGQKIGICGRTGSGKSSLTLSLFRLVHICGGKILLDDVDITSVPLDILRSRLSIIPQEPVLFSGSVRFNLDPLEQNTDDEIWQRLETAQLKTIVSSLPNQLDTMISEGGDDFSIGQKQLFCLARALLRDSRVLIMDEATASIDIDTDLIIQDIVKREFSDRTVLTIAHRLSTIQTCDHVIVLHDGVKLEEGPPMELAARPGGAYAKMLDENQL